MNIINVVGARPNFMKIAPIIEELNKYPNIFNHKLVHTGQHYDNEMSNIFFNQLNLPMPDIWLNAGSGTHAEQTAKIMVEFEKAIVKELPDLVIVVGDINSTLACSIVCSKLTVPVAHVEAGLRSFDRTMPEEINRVITDSLSEYLFTTCVEANKNLEREGIPKEKIFFVGNTMIDTLLKFKEKVSFNILNKLSIQEKGYAILTLHRPSNVDNKGNFMKILRALNEIPKIIKIIYPIHPRTMRRIQEFNMESEISNIKNLITIDPVGYLDFLSLMVYSKFVMTDSGGVQEETTVLNIPCLTLRENTERPITVTKGTNIIVGRNRDRIISETLKILENGGKTGVVPPLWDGNAAEKIVKVLIEKRDGL